MRASLATVESKAEASRDFFAIFRETERIVAEYRHLRNNFEAEWWQRGGAQIRASPFAMEVRQAEKPPLGVAAAVQGAEAENAEATPRAPEAESAPYAPEPGNGSAKTSVMRPSASAPTLGRAALSEPLRRTKYRTFGRTVPAAAAPTGRSTKMLHAYSSSDLLASPPLRGVKAHRVGASAASDAHQMPARSSASYLRNQQPGERFPRPHRSQQHMRLLALRTAREANAVARTVLPLAVSMPAVGSAGLEELCWALTRSPAER